MSNIITLVGAGRTFLSTNDLFIQANTNDSGQVEIVLPNTKLIFGNSTSNTAYNYVGVRFVDIGNNASINNIVIYAFDDDLINGQQTLTINTNGGGGLINLIGEGEWIFDENNSSIGGTPTLQQVLNNNHDLVDGNNFQGTGAGVGNSGTNVIAIGSFSAYNNTGDYVTASGYQSAFYNTGNYVDAIGSYSANTNSGCYVNAIGTKSAYCNTGDNVNAMGSNSAFCNTGSNITALGSYSAYCNTGVYVTASGYQSAYCNTGNGLTASGYNSANTNSGSYVTAIGVSSAQSNSGNNVTASGYKSAYCNTGSNVIALGTCAGFDGVIGNGISQAFIVSNLDLPTYLDYATASASITVLLGAIAGNTYLYHDQTTNSIGAVRL